MAGGNTDPQEVVVQPGLRGLVTSYLDPPPTEAIGLVISYEHVEVEKGRFRITQSDESWRYYPNLRVRLFPGTEFLARRAQRRWLRRAFDRGDTVLTMPIRVRLWPYALTASVCLGCLGLTAVLVSASLNGAHTRWAAVMIALLPLTVALPGPCLTWIGRVLRAPRWTSVRASDRSVTVTDQHGHRESIPLDEIESVRRDLGGWIVRGREGRSLCLPSAPRLDPFLSALRAMMLTRRGAATSRRSSWTLVRVWALITAGIALPLIALNVLHLSGVQTANPGIVRVRWIMILIAPLFGPLLWVIAHCGHRAERRIERRLHRGTAAQRRANFAASNRQTHPSRV